MTPQAGVVSTVGHSTRGLVEFVDLLRAAGVTLLVDVRRYPQSRRHPHFSREALSRALEEAGVAYRHEDDLGGHREPLPGSPNTAWREDAFRGYADHMATPAFQAALGRVLAAAPGTAVMCAEADPLHCHRRLLADALVARGARVVHLLKAGRSAEHALHPRARVAADGGVTYPAPLPRQRDLFGS